jgi:hypothetical protein
VEGKDKLIRLMIKKNNEKKKEEKRKKDQLIRLEGHRKFRFT